jgi:uncharacterized alkaline shock family protein YloU
MAEYLIATSVLETIVRGSLEGDERLHVHSALPLARTHAVEVSVDDEECRVTVHVDARLGENLPILAGEARRRISAALAQMTGMTVAGIDVVFSGVFPAGV